MPLGGDYGFMRDQEEETAVVRGSEKTRVNGGGEIQEVGFTWEEEAGWCFCNCTFAKSLKSFGIYN